MLTMGSGKIDGVDAISCHAFSPDMSQIALSPNSNEVLILSVLPGPASTWPVLHRLVGHDSFVSGVDWSTDGQIVSCGHDRNAYVWSLVDGTYKPKLVILRISRAATGVKWSPNGKKFAVTSGAKLVSVCHYVSENDWWVSLLLKKHRSTVLSIDWHPNSAFLVTGSCDFKARIFSAFMSDVDEPVDESIWGPIFPQHSKFGSVLAEFGQSTGWVEAVAWAPSGYALAFSGHDSSINFAHIYASGEPYTVQLNHGFLPFRDVAFLSDYCVVAVGYDRTPMLFVNTASNEDPQWSYIQALDSETSTKQTKKKTGFSKNISLFEDASTLNIEFGGKVTGLKLNTLHQNTVSALSVFRNIEFPGSKLVTSGDDGRVYFWDLASLGIDLGSLGISS